MKRPDCIRLVSVVLVMTAAVSVGGSPETPAAAPRFDSWTVLGPGGGGALFIPTVSPHDPKTVLIGCDMTGSYISRDGGNSWRMFNLRGRTRFFMFDPVDSKTIYASADGLWRSTDSGNTWSLVYPPPPSVTKVTMIDDHAGVRIMTASGYAPVITALAVDPSDSRILYAAATAGRESFLQISNDWGKSWRKLEDLPGTAHRIYVSPAPPKDNRTISVLGANFILAREEGRWKKKTMPEGVSSFRDLAGGFSGGNGTLILYGVSSEGLHVSADGGNTWGRSDISILAMAGLGPRLEAVGCSSGHPEVAYVSYSNLRRLTGTYFGVAKTADMGKTWKLVRQEARSAASNMKDAWISKRFGPGWPSNPIAIGVAPGDPNLCYTTDSGRVMRSTDGGDSWHAVYSKETSAGTYLTTGVDVTTCYGVHFDPHNSERLFISYTDIGLFRSEDGGTSWVSSTTGVPRPWVNTTYWVEFDPEVKGRMWGVMSGIHDLPRPKMWRRQDPARYNGGVCVSDDGGKTWQVASTELPPTAATHILLDPASPAAARILYVAGFGRGVFKSSDGGKSWSLKNHGIPGTTPFAWRLARDGKGALYVVVARRTEDGSYGNSGDGALYRSEDGAENWERVALPDGVNGPNGLAIDPGDPARLYLAAWRRANPEPDGLGGIYLSTDRGKTWRRVLSKDQFVYDVSIDPRDPKILYASGFQSSAWRSTDRGETWSRIRGYNFKWGHRVIPDPQDPKMIYITTFGGSVWYGPAAGDSRAVEDIVTPVMEPER